MTKIWQVQDAKARFSELLETSLTEGPQVVTKRGVEAAVLVPIEQWRRLEKMARPDLKELLLAPEARTEALTPPREKHRHRASPGFRLNPCIFSTQTLFRNCAGAIRIRASSIGLRTYPPINFFCPR